MNTENNIEKNDLHFEMNARRKWFVIHNFQVSETMNILDMFCDINTMETCLPCGLFFDFLSPQ